MAYQNIRRAGYAAMVKGYFSFVALPATLASMMTTIAHADNVDPSAPLDVLKTARETAANSNMNVEDVTTTSTNILNVILLVSAVLGVLLALISSYKLYNNIQQGEQARGSNAAYIIGLIVGSLMTILAIIVGLVTSYATGAGT